VFGALFWKKMFLMNGNCGAEGLYQRTVEISEEN
jgi:hypothetical protein